jgi:RNA polymerase sigma-70 factor (ECF subfamily)
VALTTGLAEQERTFVALCSDEVAFGRWFEVALPKVYGFVYARAGGDADLAEDVTASAFLEAVRARSSFDGRADPITWICSIARNRLIDHYRRARRDQERHVRLVVTELGAGESRDLDYIDKREAIREALSRVPTAERNALLLRYLDGYSLRETARRLGRSEAATESLLSRARERVRVLFPEGLE